MKLSSAAINKLPKLDSIIGVEKVKAIKDSLFKTHKIDFHIVTMYDYTYNWEMCVLGYGNIMGGIPACVIFKKPFIPIYVKLSDTVTPGKVKEAIDNYEKIIKVTHEKVVLKKSIEGYQHEPSQYLELGFMNGSYRSMAITLLTKEFGEVIYDNEKSNLHRNIWARYGLNAAGWLTLSKCSVVNTPIHNGLTIEVDIKDVTNGSFNDLEHKEVLRTLAWDIETKSYGEPTKKPEFDRIDEECGDYDHIKIISMSFKWHSGDYMRFKTGVPLNFILTLYDSEVPEETILVKCKDQFDLIRCFFKLIKLYRPSVIMDFYGSNFDWKMVIARLEYKDQLNIDVLTDVKLGEVKITPYMCKVGPRKVEIKIDANNTYMGTCFGFMDAVCLDLQPALKKEFDYLGGDKANFASLNDFLKDNKLQAKDDMPYEVMWKVFDSDDLEGMFKVHKYAMQDSLALHRLQEKRNIILGIQEIGNATFTCVDMGIFNANGAKIINAVRNEVYNSGMVMRKKGFVKENLSNTFGALVLQPNKGLHAYNIFDVESYSPDLQKEVKSMSLKFAQDNILRNRSYIEELQSPRLRKGLKSFLKKYPPEIQGPSWIAHRPSFAIDIKSEYPSVIRDENLSPDTKVTNQEYALFLKKSIEDGGLGLTLHRHTFAGETAWVVQHDGDPSKMGILPRILSRLFAQRLEIKKQVAAFKKAGDWFSVGLYTCKEKGVKLILNTTYGLMIDNTNHYFKDKFLGQGVCNLGRFFLLVTKIYLEHKGCIVNYGDTDSNYAQAGNKFYEELDKLYSERKISTMEYKLRMIAMSIEYGMKMGKEVNEIYKTLSRFVEIDYEETLVNACFIAAKMYWGQICVFKYEPITEVTEETVLQKGIATRKRDRSPYVKSCMKELLLSTCSLDLKRSLLDLCVEQVTHMDNDKYDRSIFMQKATYKKTPQGGNKKVNTFVERMKNKYDIDIDNLQKFSYYVVVNGCGLSIKGTKITKLGDRMMLCEIVDHPELGKDMKLDMMYYIESYVKAISGILTYKFRDPKEAKTYLLNMVKSDDRALRKEANANFRAYKNERYHALDVVTNIKVIMGHDLIKTILEKTLTEVNSLFYNIPGQIAPSKYEGYTFGYHARSEFYKEQIGLRKKSYAEIYGKNRVKAAASGAHKEQLAIINTLLANINADKKRFVSIMENYHDHINSKGTVELCGDDLTLLTDYMSKLKNAFVEYGILSGMLSNSDY